jgi:transcriptional regulator with GAF, ATPase, and Fis domain
MPEVTGSSPVPPTEVPGAPGPPGFLPCRSAASRAVLRHAPHPLHPGACAGPRVLQDGSFERVGGQETLTADVRIEAATHRNMERLVAEGRFREDLWYRISVCPIYLPPLRARQDDIPALARHFANNAGLRFGGAPLEPSPADLDLLAEYPWPGNVREMAAVMERAAILGGGHLLDLRGAMETKLHAVRERATGVAVPGESAAGPSARLDDAMRRHVQAALRAAGGRIEGPRGAAALGVNPSTLRGRMRKLGIGVKRET